MSVQYTNITPAMVVEVEDDSWHGHAVGKLAMLWWQWLAVGNEVRQQSSHSKFTAAVSKYWEICSNAFFISTFRCKLREVF